MNKKNKSLIKNIGLFTIGSFGSKILSFLLLPLYTAVLTANEYGSVDLVTSTASLLTPILLLSVFDATLRFGMDSNYSKEDVISTSFDVAIKGTLLLLIVSLIFSLFNIIKVPTLYLVFLNIYFILGSLNQIFNLYLKTKNQVTTIVISGILCTFVSCVLNILLLVVFKYGIIGYMIGTSFGIFVQVMYQLIIGKIYKDIKYKKYNNLKKPMLKYSFPLIANSISWWVNNVSDRYVVTLLKGVVNNGIYSVSYKIPTILSMFQGIFYNAWSISAITEFDKDDSDGFIGTNYTLYSYISLIICSMLIVINIPLASFLYKGNYFVAWKCVPFLLVGTVFSGISQFEGSLFAAIKNTKLVARTTIIGAIVNTLLNFILISLFGIIGAALATLIGYFIVWVLRTKYLQKFVTMKVAWKTHFLSIILVIIQSIFATLNISMLIQVLFLLSLLVINIDNISPLINKLTKKQKKSKI